MSQFQHGTIIVIQVGVNVTKRGIKQKKKKYKKLGDKYYG